MSKISFNTLLEEAHRDPVEIEMPDGKPVVVEFPTGDVAKQIQTSMTSGDEDAAFLIMFGDADGKRLLEQFKSAPADVPGRLLKMVFNEFGVTDGFFAQST